MRLIITLIVILLACSSKESDSTIYTIRVNFLYGSKPAKGFKQHESKLFGGLKGGHVNIEAGGRVLDFMPGNNPLFPKNSHPTGGFRLSNRVYWDTATNEWSSVIIPVSKDQYDQLQSLFDSLSHHTPYDYAILGMRCAAASYDVLSRIGLFRELSNGDNIRKYFYPKPLRKKIIKWAVRNNFTITHQQGRSSRKWESNKGIF